jgi:hypothetical protein
MRPQDTPLCGRTLLKPCYYDQAAGGDNSYMKLVNKTPRWNESLGAFCLNFQAYICIHIICIHTHTHTHTYVHTYIHVTCVLILQGRVTVVEKLVFTHVYTSKRKLLHAC